MPPEVAHTQVYRLLASAPDDQAAGHWWAINPGVAGSITVTSGALSTQVRAVRGLDLSDSQADSASSILVTRSMAEPKVSGHADHGSRFARVLLISMGARSSADIALKPDFIELVCS
jgi:hypothetical protein